MRLQAADSLAGAIAEQLEDGGEQDEADQLTLPI
jgi:hypothetical protein